MGLRDDIQEALTEAFGGDLSDVVKAFNYVAIVKGAYDPVSGVFAETETVTPSRGVFDTVTTDQLGDTQIKSTDIVLIVNEVDITADPTIDDLIRTDVNEYRIIKVKQVLEETVAVIYEIFIRRVTS